MNLYLTFFLKKIYFLLVFYFKFITISNTDLALLIELLESLILNSCIIRIFINIII